MTTKPKTRKAPAAGIHDPAFALIDAHKALTKKTTRLYSELDEAEFEAGKTHGWRPSSLIAWCNYGAIGEYGIDMCCEELLSQPGADRKQISKEYRAAKARLAAAERAGVEWDQRAGIAPLREQYERAALAERRAAMRMARTKPVSLAGAAALIAYTRRDIIEGAVDWQMVALKTAAVALARMEAA